MSAPVAALLQMLASADPEERAAALQIARAEKINLIQALQDADLDLFGFATPESLAGIASVCAFGKPVGRTITALSPLFPFKDRIESLSIHTSALADLSALPEFPNLRSLHLFGNQVLDAQLVHIARCPKLETLHLAEDNIFLLAGLNGAPKLQHLTIAATARHYRTEFGRTEDASLASLHDLPMLHTLWLPFLPISDLSFLAAFPQIKELNLSNTTVSNLRPLSALPNLQTLFCDNTYVSDLTPLLELDALTRLHIRGFYMPSKRSELQSLRALRPELDIID